eukprot:TRINITY_DN32172_c0_g1_i1.p2 TRINITY_DN32172_c0_g1~~TRINITY_DN32172_c0_g1_i1.p2  ORF type:complete len:125 (-),score=27.13 TRINITY_DN32172_c0_g1_i1:345-719(-)
MSLSKKLPIPKTETESVCVAAIICIFKSAFLCFDEETQVITDDGKSVAVKDITEGDRILSIKDASNLQANAMMRFKCHFSSRFICSSQIGIFQWKIPHRHLTSSDDDPEGWHHANGCCQGCASP